MAYKVYTIKIILGANKQDNIFFRVLLWFLKHIGGVPIIFLSFVDPVFFIPLSI